MMKAYVHTPGIRRNAGFSLVDIMVGMVISLIGVIIIFQVFSVSEGIKRTTTSGGDAQQNGAAALFVMERALKEAGYGLNATDPTTTYPAQINLGATTADPDSIDINSRKNWDYGPFSPNATAFPSAVPPALTDDTYSVSNAAEFGYAVNAGTFVPIADGVVLLKAQYGTDANGDGIVDSTEWSVAAPASPLQVMAVRVAIVARSAQPEKPNPATGVCATTTVSPTWAGGTLDLSGNRGLAAGDDWKCYRYKVFQTTVPLRNVIWR
ncbi:MAG: hypothetical protein GC139_00915 [Sideroxydans sp.]|nr:hypothetical protein [Sideroxydans sp.]